MLLSSRILLKALGTEDFGLYNLVGSIVAMFTSLRVVFASATQRFLNYEKANNNVQTLSNIFTISKRLHGGLSLIFLIITEALGIWMLHSYLNIPDGKLTDSYIVLQCSIFSAIAMLMTVPYDAVIISNEKFNAYACFAILECLLQLGAAFIIIIIPGNKLVWYSILILMIALLVRFVNMLYCRLSFIECRHKGYFDKATFKDMSKFAGWNFLGNFALSIYNEGINMVLNIFGGVLANAARAISSQVIKGLSSISDRMSTAFAPQATQQYAIGELDSFHELIFLSTKLINYIYLLMAIPIALFTPLVLEIWLGEVPIHSVEFTGAILLIAISKEQNKYVTLLLFITAVSCHIVALLLILGYVATKVITDSRIWLCLWVVMVLALFMGFFDSFEQWGNAMMSLEDDRFERYLLGSSINYETGLRIDFIAYSLFPIIIGGYYTYIKKYKDVFYRHLYNTYIFCNAC
jgi:O-antigen/teichoic acid export membrane protein